MPNDISHEQKQHHHFTNNGEDYTIFTIQCESCGMPLYEFVHKQVYVGRTKWSNGDRIFAEPGYAESTPSGYAQSQSWVKPAVKVVCEKHPYGIPTSHMFVPVLPGEDRNQAVRSRSMTAAEFLEWSKEVPHEGH